MSARNDTFPVQSSVLSEGALAGFIAGAYDLPGPLSCRLISSSVNEVYAVTAGTQRAYLRVSRTGWREPHELDAEVHLVDDLQRNGLPVAAPLQRRDRHHYVTYLPAPEGTRPVVLWSAALGEDVADLSVGQAEAFGRLAGRLHHVSGAIGPVYRRPEISLVAMVDEALASIRRVMAVPDGRADWQRLQTTAADVRHVLAELEADEQADRGLIHGDLHPGNLRFVGDAPTLFDFDLCGYGLRAYDLAIFRWNMALEGRQSRWVTSRWRAFLDGYQRERPLPAAVQDVRALHALLITRMLWLMGMDASGRSGYLPQNVTLGSMRQMQGHIDIWDATLRSLSAGVVN